MSTYWTNILLTFRELPADEIEKEIVMRKGHEGIGSSERYHQLLDHDPGKEVWRKVA